MRSVAALTLAIAILAVALPAHGQPLHRSRHSAIFDSVRQRMLVFGGYDDDTSRTFGDTWALSLDDAPTWHQVAVSGTPPPARFGHSAIYDSVGDRMIVFGGYGGPSQSGLNDCWALSLSDSSWSPLTVDGTPPSARYY